MATKTLKTVDVQLLNAERKSAKTYKLDNPKDGLTRAEIAEAFSPALTSSWLLAADGSPALYLGDTILNTSIKESLDGEDFYVTPASIQFNTGLTPQTATITVTGAQIQGYNIKQTGGDSSLVSLSVVIAENGLTATVRTTTTAESGSIGGAWNLILIIQGTAITVPVTRQ